MNDRRLATAADLPLDLPDTAWRSRFRARVRRWYTVHARDLPWRGAGDPYAVWVSEIMLQQTQVATVRGYFDRFMEAFPTIAALAAADPARVLRLWEGLGYYRRARQLHAAAKVIVDQHEGRFPQKLEQVQALPGIGRYTAGAILSIAMDQRVPILEANTIRLFARLLALELPVESTAAQKTLWAMAQAVLPRSDVGHFNQALMDLGSLVCVNGQPDCTKCPVHGCCRSREAGIQADLPRKRAKAPTEELHEAVVIVERSGRWLVRQCGEDERWAGLWDFPRLRLACGGSEKKKLQGANGRIDTALRRRLVDGVMALTGVRIAPREHVTTFRHGVTRYRITLDCFRAEYVSGRLTDPESMRWVDREELHHLPLSTTGRKTARRIGS